MRGPQLGRPARRPQGPAVPLRDRQDGATFRQTDTARGRLAHGAPPCRRCRNRGRGRRPHFPAPRGLRTTSRTAAASRSRNVWPDTRTPRRQGFMTGVTMTSAWAKWRESGFERNYCAEMAVSPKLFGRNFSTRIISRMAFRVAARCRRDSASPLGTPGPLRSCSRAC